jgi:hypothetical protein
MMYGNIALSFEKEFSCPQAEAAPAGRAIFARKHK